MLEVRQTSHYADWFSKLKDRATRVRIDVRIRRLSLGNPGGVRSVGRGVQELRIHYGAGYRVYFTMRRGEYVLSLAGGDKSSQDDDIRKAHALNMDL